MRNSDVSPEGPRNPPIGSTRLARRDFLKLIFFACCELVFSSKLRWLPRLGERLDLLMMPEELKKEYHEWEKSVKDLASIFGNYAVPGVDNHAFARGFIKPVLSPEYRPPTPSERKQWQLIEEPDNTTQNLYGIFEYLMSFLTIMPEFQQLAYATEVARIWYGVGGYISPAEGSCVNPQRCGILQLGIGVPPRIIDGAISWYDYSRFIVSFLHEMVGHGVDSPWTMLVYGKRKIPEIIRFKTLNNRLLMETFLKITRLSAEERKEFVDSILFDALPREKIQKMIVLGRSSRIFGDINFDEYNQRLEDRLNDVELWNISNDLQREFTLRALDVYAEVSATDYQEVRRELRDVVRKRIDPKNRFLADTDWELRVLLFIARRFAGTLYHILLGPWQTLEDNRETRLPLTTEQIGGVVSFQRPVMEATFRRVSIALDFASGVEILDLPSYKEALVRVLVFTNKIKDEFG